MDKGNGYDCLSRYYDRLTPDIDYASMAELTLDIFTGYRGRRPELLLDLACGTGSLSIILAKEGIQVIGVDNSAGMLSEAYLKSREADVEVLFLQQDMCHFELYGTVDVITCYLDSVNHIIVPEELQNLFKSVNNYLSPGGLFIFDVNTRYKFEKIYSDNVFYESFEDLTYIWRNKYSSRKGTAVFDLTFFVKEGDGRYRKEEGRIQERCYGEDELAAMIRHASLELIAEHDGFSLEKVKKDTQRILYILQSRKTFSKD